MKCATSSLCPWKDAAHGSTRRAASGGNSCIVLALPDISVWKAGKSTRRLQKKQRGRSPAWTAKSFFYTSTLFRNHSFLEGYQSAGPTDAVNVQASRVGFGPLLALHAMLFSAFSVECTAAATFTCATSSLCTWKDVAVGRSVVGTMPHGPTCCLRGWCCIALLSDRRTRVRTAMGWDGDMVTGTGSGGMGRGLATMTGAAS